jgi:hypothetical protein
MNYDLRYWFIYPNYKISGNELRHRRTYVRRKGTRISAVIPLNWTNQFIYNLLSSYSIIDYHNSYKNGSDFNILFVTLWTKEEAEYMINEFKNKKFNNFEIMFKLTGY